MIIITSIFFTKWGILIYLSGYKIFKYRLVKWSNSIKPKNLYLYSDIHDNQMPLLWDTWPHRHKTFECSQGNSQLKYLNISSTLITFSDLSMYRLEDSQLPHSRTRIFELRIFLKIRKSLMRLGPNKIVLMRKMNNW
jgi:hypothetical protein